jgi:AcrR family transcriptional regulator
MPRGRTVSPESEAAKRQHILDAAVRCCIELGMDRTSVMDVARAADVSRGTVYRYFPDREALIGAVVETGSQQYFADAATAMGSRSTLAEQVGAFAATAADTAVAHRSRDRVRDGDVALMRLIVADADATLGRTMRFLEPYVRAAVDRGEIPAATDVDDACEWLARVIISISSVPSSSHFDIADAGSVAAFVERYAVAGLQPKP